MSLQRSHYTTEEKHACLREMRRERARLVEDARVAYAKGDSAGAEKKFAEVRRLDNIVIMTLKNDPKFAPNGPDELWDFKPIDEEDFMGKSYIHTRTGDKTMLYLTAHKNSAQEMNETLDRLAKLSPFERSVVMAKVEREKAQNLAKAQGDTLKKTGTKTWGEHFCFAPGTPLNPR